MSRQYVMNSKNLMIDQSFNEIEHAPAAERSSNQCLSTPFSVRLLSGAEEHSNADHREDPSCQMEESILGILSLQCRHGLGLTGFGGADQVMPAQDLVQHDSIEETTEAKAQHNSRFRR